MAQKPHQTLYRNTPLNQPLQVFAGTCLIITLALFRLPYRGIWHDSTLYLGQVLYTIQPAIFTNDLFFAFGSQAQYTLFPQLIAHILTKGQMGTVFLLLTLFALSSFLLASWQLSHQLFPRGFALAALVAVVLLPKDYGPSSILSYAEPFLTGRSFAEPLILATLAAWLANRKILAILVCFAAALLHPLQTLPVFGFMWLWQIQESRRWLHLAWLGLPIAFLAITNVAPFHILFEKFDEEWLHAVWQRDLIVFITKAQPGDWYFILTDVFLAAVLVRNSQGLLRRCAATMLITFLIFLLGSIILADVLKLTLPTGLQLWRAHWLLHWMAMASLPWLCFRLWTSATTHTQKLRLIVFAAIVLLGIRPSAAPDAILGLIVLYTAWPYLFRYSGGILPWIAGTVVTGVAIVGTVTHLRVLAAWGDLPTTGGTPDLLPAYLMP